MQVLSLLLRFKSKATVVFNHQFRLITSLLIHEATADIFQADPSNGDTGLLSFIPDFSGLSGGADAGDELDAQDDLSQTVASPVDPIAPSDLFADPSSAFEPTANGGPVPDPSSIYNPFGISSEPTQTALLSPMIPPPSADNFQTLFGNANGSTLPPDAFGGGISTAPAGQPVDPDWLDDPFAPAAPPPVYMDPTSQAIPSTIPSDPASMASPNAASGYIPPVVSDDLMEQTASDAASVGASWNQISSEA